MAVQSLARMVYSKVATCGMPCTLKQGEKSTIDVGKEQQGRRDGAEDLVDRRFCVGEKVIVRDQSVVQGWRRSGGVVGV